MVTPVPESFSILDAEQAKSFFAYAGKTRKVFRHI